MMKSENLLPTSYALTLLGQMEGESYAVMKRTRLKWINYNRSEEKKKSKESCSMNWSIYAKSKMKCSAQRLKYVYVENNLILFSFALLSPWNAFYCGNESQRYKRVFLLFSDLRYWQKCIHSYNNNKTPNDNH